MKAYFVRKAENREIVGLFVAPSTMLLAALVDECCDPNICDYTVAGMGGLMVAEVTSELSPLREMSTGFEQAVPTQQWEEALKSDNSQIKWMPLKRGAMKFYQELGRGQS